MNGRPNTPCVHANLHFENTIQNFDDIYFIILFHLFFFFIWCKVKTNRALCNSGFILNICTVVFGNWLKVSENYIILCLSYLTNTLEVRLLPPIMKGIFDKSELEEALSLSSNFTLFVSIDFVWNRSRTEEDFRCLLLVKRLTHKWII